MQASLRLPVYQKLLLEIASSFSFHRSFIASTTSEKPYVDVEAREVILKICSSMNDAYKSEKGDFG